MYGVATQNGVGVSLGNIPALTSLAYPQMLNAIVLGAFSGGAPGWLYDDTNQSTLFQDAAGTTPVTALEQPVGLQLDLSQGMVLGSELVTNGDFSNGTTGWTAHNATQTAVNNQVQVTSTSGSLYGSTGQVVGGLTVGKTYKVVVPFTKGTTDGRIDVNGVSGVASLSASGVMSCYFVATGTTAVISAVNTTVSVGVTSSYGPFSCKQIAGNHRYQPTSANRPTWSARYNLYTKTENPSTWNKGTGATTFDNQVVAPNGTLTGGKIVYDGSGSAGGLRAYATGDTISVNGTSYKNGIYLRADSPISLRLYGNDVAGSFTVINITTSWQLFQLTGTGNGASSLQILIYGLVGDNSPFTIYAWGIDVRPSDQATGLIPTYQRVNTATDYDANGFPAGLRWNGSNSWMQNASVDFSGTNKLSVFVGVRKQSDADSGTVCELSASVDANNASWALFGPSSGGATNFAFYSRGTAQQGVSATGYAAPITKVLAGLGDISAPSATIRLNGTQVATSSATQGSGNYSSNPAYFGARAGTSTFFNGLTFSNIAIGVALSASQIAAFEAWTNSKARAY